MRIRRRPQGQLSFPWLLPSDPPAPQPPPNASPRGDHHHLELAAGDKGEEELHPNADLRDEQAPTLLPLFPQDNDVVERGRDLQGAHGAPAAADGHGSLENGDHHKPEPVANDIISQAMPVSAVSPMVQKEEEAVKDDSSSGGGGIKKRLGSDVLLEGSRCSRVNGRTWRCSQPTLPCYSLCEHHLRMARLRNAAWRAANGRKRRRRRRTEHQQKAPAVAVTAAPKADEPPPTSVSHC